MARSGNPNSTGSQFFIMHENAPNLDGDYAAFCKLIEGEDTLNDIASVPTDWEDRPQKPPVMKSVTVETFGVEYPEPKRFKIFIEAVKVSANDNPMFQSM